MRACSRLILSATHIARALKGLGGCSLALEGVHPQRRQACARTGSGVRCRRARRVAQGSDQGGRASAPPCLPGTSHGPRACVAGHTAAFSITGKPAYSAPAGDQLGTSTGRSPLADAESRSTACAWGSSLVALQPAGAPAGSSPGVTPAPLLHPFHPAHPPTPSFSTRSAAACAAASGPRAPPPPALPALRRRAGLCSAKPQPPYKDACHLYKNKSLRRGTIK